MKYFINRNLLLINRNVPLKRKKMSKVTYKMEGHKNNAFATVADDIDGKFIRIV